MQPVTPLDLMESGSLHYSATRGTSRYESWSSGQHLYTTDGVDTVSAGTVGPGLAEALYDQGHRLVC